MATGSANRLAFVAESAWGTPGSTTYTTVRKLAGAGLGTDRTQIQSQELNSRRAVTSIRLGTRKATATVPFELSSTSSTAGQFDEFMSSWMLNAWTAAATAIAAQTVTVGTPAATTTFTCGTSAGTVAVGDWVKVSGFTSTAAVDNGYYRVSAVSSLILTLVTPNYSAMIAASTNNTAVVIQRMAYDIPGTTLAGNSIAFEEAQTDLTVPMYKQVIGAIANTFTLTLTPDQIITGTFDFIAKTFAESTTAYSSAITAAPTNNVMTCNDSLMYLMFDNAAVGVVSNLTLNGTNNAEAMFPIGALTAYQLGIGTSQLTGTMDIYLTDDSFWSKYQAETTMGLSIRLMDPDGVTGTTMSANGYAIDIPTIKLVGLSETKSQTNVIQSVSWSSTETATTGTKGGATVNMRINKLI